MKPKEIVVVSGKGGTGKTSLVAAFASLAEGVVLADCDVDAADLHLLMSPKVLRSEEFSGGGKAVIRPRDCIRCGACLAHCRFDAVLRRDGGAEGDSFTVDPLSCEGCGVCVWHCPADAVDFRPNVSGEWYVSETRRGPMVHARLRIAEENSGKLVSMVRREAAKLAEERGLGLILTDGPPGIGCPVIASFGRTDMALVVAEPTVSGLHDLKRVMELAARFGVPAKVCINKCDINPRMAEEIRAACRAQGVAVAGGLPYDPDVTRAQMLAKSVVECSDGPAAAEAKRMWSGIETSLKACGPAHGE